MFKLYNLKENLLEIKLFILKHYADIPVKQLR